MREQLRDPQRSGRCCPTTQARANRLKIDWDDHVIADALVRRATVSGRRAARRDREVHRLDVLLLRVGAEGPLSRRILEHPQYGAAARELYDNAQDAAEADHRRASCLRRAGVYGFWPANTDRRRHRRLHGRRSRARSSRGCRCSASRKRIADGRPNRSLADFIAPTESGVPDYLGVFAVTGGLGADELVQALRGRPRRLQRHHGEGAGRSPGGSLRRVPARAGARATGATASTSSCRPTT